MKTITALQAKNRFGRLIDAARREPVTVTKNGQPSVVVVSAEDWARRRKRAWKNLIGTMHEVGKQAATRGLTEKRLEKLLADEG